MVVDPGSVLSSRYAIGRCVGTGGTGEVWQARDTVLGRDVALKVMVGGSHERLAIEARAAAVVNDRNVVTVFDAELAGEDSYLVMEYVEGVDLGQVLRHHGKLPADVVALLGRDLARGLGAVHRAEIVHRDVKPGNVLLTSHGEVKLGDLGIARSQDSPSAQLTNTGTIVGTVDYLAPEQLSDAPATPSTDVYATGLLLLESVTGRRPFGDGTVAERAARRLTERPTPPDGIDDALRTALVAATKKQPDARPADGGALAELLDAAIDDEDRARQRLADLVGSTPVETDEPPTRTAGTGGVDVPTVVFTPEDALDVAG